MIINYALGLNMITVWLSLIGVVISISIFYISRYKRWFTSTIVLLYTIATILVLGFMHFYNAGSYGPVIYLIVMLLNIFVLVSKKKQQIIIYLLLSTTVLALLVIEYYHPEFVVAYRSDAERLIDHTTCILYSMFFTMLVARIFKNSYDKDRVLILEQKNELQTAYDATSTKNLYIESLLRELHHRVKNNLQVISSLMLMQSNRVDDENARQALDEGRKRVEAISLVHQKLYLDNDLARVNIQDYLSTLSATLAESFGKDAGNIRTETGQGFPLVDIDIAVTLGLIVNELVSNCFKHAFTNCPEPLVRISLSAINSERLMLKVSDNGRWVVRDNKHESFGMKLVNILVQQMKGIMEIEKINGTTVSIELQYTDGR